jgi:hypothetical protein
MNYNACGKNQSRKSLNEISRWLGMTIIFSLRPLRLCGLRLFFSATPDRLKKDIDIEGIKS